MVASTPITPERVWATAGLMAGSIATSGTGSCERSFSTATAVAVLQATTMTPAPASSKASVMRAARAAMKAGGRCP